MSAKVDGRRAIVLIIDGCGVGAAPDAKSFGDSEHANSLANVSLKMGGLKLPNLERLGLGNITSVVGLKPVNDAEGSFGKLEEISVGKDTQTGHWELMGIVNKVAFPMYPNGFPKEIIDRFIAETGCKNILCNMPASGTEVLKQLGEEHQKTGFPIVYTSGDSVFQIACHTDVVPLPTLYRWCEIARNILQGEHRVGRVIARPFAGSPGNYNRLGGDRRDYAVPPPAPTMMDQLLKTGAGILGIGKIEDIFCRHGLTHAKHTGSNKEGLELTLEAVKKELPLSDIAIVDDAPSSVQFIFTNLVDTDMLYGHRRNVEGYAKALEEIDQWLSKIMSAMGQEDLLVITSDHGNDPTAPGTDHTREYVPLIVYSPSLKNAARDLKVRKGFYDVSASLASWLGLVWDGPGKSFVADLVAQR